jgi:hypothetical protein
MRKLDKKYHKALKFFDKHTKSKVDRIKQEDIQKYRKYVVEDIESDLEEEKFIDTDPMSFRKYALTQKGKEELRVLDEMITNKKTLIISIIALFVATISIIIEFYRGG